MASSMTVQGSGVVVSSPNTTAVFIPMTQWVPALEVLKARATLEMRGNSQYCGINGAYQTSNDMVSVDSAASILSSPSYLTADGYQYPSAFSDLSSALAGKGYVRFGLQCRAESPGSVPQGCWASIRVDIQGP